MRNGNRHADIENRHVVAKGKEKHERVGLGVGTRRLYYIWNG